MKKQKTSSRKLAKIARRNGTDDKGYFPERVVQHMEHNGLFYQWVGRKNSKRLQYRNPVEEARRQQRRDQANKPSPSSDSPSSDSPLVDNKETTE